MEYKEIQDLLKLVNKTNLTEVEIERKDFRIKIRRKTSENNVIYTQAQAPAVAVPPPAPVAAAVPAPQAVAAATPAPQTAAEPAKEALPANTIVIKSPMIGTFYRSSSPETPPFVSVGDTVSKGQAICIVEAMKLFNEIESEHEGKIVKIYVENAQPVEYDQDLFLLELNS